MNYEGVIGEIDLVQRLVELGRGQFTGAIRFENDGVIKIVYFKGGDVLSASTNDRTDSIDEILMRAGKVTREHVKQALAKRKESETLGDAMLGLGFITRKELTWARRVQVIGILRSVLGWPGGSYTIVADYLPKREEGTIFPLNQIIVEMIVTDQDRAKFERAMESGTAVFAKTAGFDDGFRRLGLNEDAEQIAAQIDGDRTASEVAGASGKDVFNVYKLLDALRVLGLLERREGFAEPARLDDFAAVGAADAADAWKLEDEPAPPPPKPEPPAPLPPMPTWDVPTAPAVSARSVWDEPDEPVVPAEPEEPAYQELGNEAQWGFDEAQIETARRAAVPVGRDDEGSKMTTPTERAAPQPRRVNILVLLLVLVLLAAGGWYGWTWWQGRVAHTEAAAVAPPKPHRSPLRQQPMQSTSTAAPAPITPAPVTPAPAPAAETTDTSKPLPTVQRKSPAPVPAPAPMPSGTPRIERTTTGAATITNTPAAGSSDATAEKYAAMAREFAAKPGGAYTVQFELVCETASITKALRAGGAEVWFAPMSYHGRSCYRVFWGRYDTRDAASTAAKTIPKALAGSAPVVVKIPR